LLDLTGENAVRQWFADGRQAERASSPLSGVQGEILSPPKRLRFRVGCLFAGWRRFGHRCKKRFLRFFTLVTFLRF